MWDTEPSPASNPAWVRFIQDNNDSILGSMLICIALGLLITRISRKRKEEDT